MVEPIYTEWEVLICAVLYALSMVGVYALGEAKALEKFLERLANSLNPNIEEVTRCKDCKYYNAKVCMCFLHWNESEDDGFSFTTWPEDYCKFAEKKSDKGG